MQLWVIVLWMKYFVERCDVELLISDGLTFEETVIERRGCN